MSGLSYCHSTCDCGCTMAPQPGVLLSLTLCLALLSATRENDLLSPPPSISTQQGPEGQPVTLVCRGPAGVSTFRLENRQSRCGDRNPMCMEKDCVNKTCVSCNYMDKAVVSQSGPGETEAQFPIGAVSGDSEMCYRCLYHKGSRWSLPSEPLKLVVTLGVISTEPPGSQRTSVSPTQPQPSGGDWQQTTWPQRVPPPGQPLKLEYIISAVAAITAVVLLLLLLLLLLLHRRRKHGSLGGKGKEGRRQESSILAGGHSEKTPDLATADGCPMGAMDRASPTPDAGGPEEVTYAQLDHRTLTQRPPDAAPSQAVDPTAESCTYAALARP